MIMLDRLQLYLEKAVDNYSFKYDPTHNAFIRKKTKPSDKKKEPKLKSKPIIFNKKQGLRSEKHYRDLIAKPKHNHVKFSKNTMSKWWNGLSDQEQTDYLNAHKKSKFKKTAHQKPNLLGIELPEHEIHKENFDSHGNPLHIDPKHWYNLSVEKRASILRNGLKGRTDDELKDIIRKHINKTTDKPLRSQFKDDESYNKALNKHKERVNKIFDSIGLEKYVMPEETFIEKVKNRKNHHEKSEYTDKLNVDPQEKEKFIKDIEDNQDNIVDKLHEDIPDDKKEEINSTIEKFYKGKKLSASDKRELNDLTLNIVKFAGIGALVVGGAIVPIPDLLNEQIHNAHAIYKGIDSSDKQEDINEMDNQKNMQKFLKHLKKLEKDNDKGNKIVSNARLYLIKKIEMADAIIRSKFKSNIKNFLNTIILTLKHS